MKKIGFIGILMFLIFFGVFFVLQSSSVTLSSSEESPKLDRISIAHKEIFGSLEYGTVLFEHQKHVESLAKTLKKPQKLTCQECHSQDKFGEFSFDFPKNLKSIDPQAVKNAYHEQCLRCHQKLSIEKKKTGPVILSCRECHRKEYKNMTVKYPKFEFDFALHDKHVKKFAKDCSLCHHTYDIEEKNKELALVYEKGTEQSCYYCHDLNKKRGPELSKIVKVAKQNNWDIKRAFHSLCLNCHLQNKLEAKEAGPVQCSKCHTGKYKTVEELKDVPRPERDQPKTAFINIEEAKMKGVPFNHEFHEKNNKTCRSCHHETLKSCKECHNLKGKQEGGFVSVLTAYHSQNSQISCQGCHRSLIGKKECMGCHYFITPVKTEIANKEICSRCHSGKKEIGKVSPFTVFTQKVKEEVVIKHIEKDFEPVKMPHYKIVKKLTDISNQSRLATYFHKDLNTICKGCRYCMVACPFGIPAYEYYDPITPQITKCTMCFDRITEGKTPACVEICPADALIFGPRSEMLKLAYERINNNPERYIQHVYGEHEAGGTNWLYISGVAFEKLGFPKLDKTPIPTYSKNFLFTVKVLEIVAAAPLVWDAYYMISKNKKEKEESNEKQ